MFSAIRAALVIRHHVRHLTVPSTVAKNIRAIGMDDIVSVEKYKENREELKAWRTSIKVPRRVEVGPFVGILFTNYDLMWMQVHEMVLVEKGGMEQFKDEIEAYNPLIPQGNNLVATLMVEVDNKVRRDRVLRKLCGIEKHVVLQWGNNSVRSAPLSDEERTTADGKTSAVHFLKFDFSPTLKEDFKSTSSPVSLTLDHAEYSHGTVLTANSLQALRQDLSVA